MDYALIPLVIGCALLGVIAYGAVQWFTSAPQHGDDGSSLRDGAALGPRHPLS